MSRLLQAALIAVLVVAWIATGVYDYLRLERATELAESVARGTRTFQHELDNPRMDLLAEHAFPQDRVFEAVKGAWAEPVRAGQHASSVLGPPARPGGRPGS
jgi:hypothetical protein